ncbi:unnamed protein product [Linum tenue]|uniref:Thaumatin-like protein n=1 Tax=Linum tenue TaxID=586396 RepID=A0AAV0JPD6_9ROSI|nr:unnamed protein product [Linum tenue]
MQITSSFLIFFFHFPALISITDGATTELTILNNCDYSVWPGILGNAGHSTPKQGGFHLCRGQQVTFQVPRHWSGRIWPRQGCSFDQSTKKGYCQTGDCSGMLECRGIGGVPPATLVEMTLGTSASALHFYDVSLLDGFNVPVSVVPINGLGRECGVAACEADLNAVCPSVLVIERQGKVVGCKSACLAAKSDSYCCRGEFADPKACKPSVFGIVFKAICPRAYSFAFDEASGLKTCIAPRYVITFCPS